MREGLMRGEDGVVRCSWHNGKGDYQAYHDEEWGRPELDDVRLFEKICLEGFQSGLSWLTILRKRDNFRAAFDGFDFSKVAEYGADDVERLLDDKGIVRHRRKIESTINNAQKAIELVDEFGSLARFFWSHEPDPSARATPITWEYIMANPTTPGSVKLSKELKKRGWSFVGPTTAYAFMQAMGLVNDHVQGCAFRDIVRDERAALVRPR